MNKNRKRTITVNRKPQVDLNGAADFVKHGADIDNISSSPAVSPAIEYPWLDDSKDMKELIPVAQLYLPREYALKLDYLAQVIGFKKQSVIRNSVKPEIDRILKENGVK